MNEWGFTTDVASWINEILQTKPSLPFSRARNEERGSGSLKRRDITLLDKNRQAVLTGEVKLPYAKDGSSPYIDSVVADARSKAQKANARFFFTWNVNEFVLWETDPAKEGLPGQKYKSWNIVTVHKESHLDQSPTIQTIRTWLAKFLEEFDQTLRGTAPIGFKAPDEKFIDMLESSLRVPIALNFEELVLLYKSPQSKVALDKWMRDEQGWTILDDPQGITDNLERASKFACYALVNKLVFHEALLKRYHGRMESLTVPDHIDTANNLRLHLEKYFAEAKDVTGDYETVFGEDHTAIGNRIPFYADSAVPHWRQLINQIHVFDFSKLDYEIIGNIFERLISPEERHKYGQFYTRVEVVDLINSFCIRTGKETVMDPACGGGTFLVRAYVRKREIDPSRKHGKLLSDLFGVDISHFATHLTTINLATRDLIDDENYPQISRSDFFDIKAHQTFISLPKRMESKGLGKMQHRKIEIPLLDAVVGNPPYLRQEDIPKDYKKGKKGPSTGTKDYYLNLVRQEANIKLSGRSDIHCYFWPHAATFLKDDGYLCLLTSSQWLDVEYGFRLQEWILKNFSIVAIFESIDEPWFVGARVATTATILKRETDDEKRKQNILRLVQLRRPLSEVFAHDGTTAGVVTVADQFRDEILSLEENTVNQRYRARLINQGDLWEEGIRLGVVMSKSAASEILDGEEDESNNEVFQIQAGSYYGGKWGIYLRAPDLWFELLDEYRDKLTPLGNLAEIRFGVKSGKDSFFYPIDASSDCIQAVADPDVFVQRYGVFRKDVASGKVKLVRCGEGRGEIRPIEAKYLEPEVHSLMEIDDFTVTPENCTRLVLLVGDKKPQLKGTHVLKYIKWGEKQNVHAGATCAARVTEDREWYDLTGHSRGSLFWAKSQQYKHVIPLNTQNLQCNCNLYDMHLPSRIDPSAMAGILNSTWAVLSKFLYGRQVGVEGNLKTEVVDVNMMLIPDPTKATARTLMRISVAFNQMKTRKPLTFLSERRLRQMAFTKAGKDEELAMLSDASELEMPDRRELDDAVLEMIGVSLPERRFDLIDRLYAYLRDFFEQTRQKEEKAIVNKIIAKRRGPIRPAEIAVQIRDDISQNEQHLLRHYDADFLDKSKDFDTYDLPAEGTAQSYSDMLMPHGVRFVKGTKTELALIETKTPEQAELLTLLANAGTRGLVRIPHEDAENRRLLESYGAFLEQRDQRVKELIQERTADEDTQIKILQALMPLL